MAKKQKKRINYDPYEETMEAALRDEGKFMRIDLTAYRRRVKENDELNNELTVPIRLTQTPTTCRVRS